MAVRSAMFAGHFRVGPALRRAMHTTRPHRRAVCCGEVIIAKLQLLWPKPSVLERE